MVINKNCSGCIHHEVCIARHNAGHDNTCYTDCGGYCTEFIDKELIECDGRCLNYNNYGTSACPDINN